KSQQYLKRKSKPSYTKASKRKFLGRMKKFIFYKIIDLLAGKFIVQRIKKQALMSLLPVTNLLSSD
ncbi:hypothetical protein, partial [Vibrio aestuarianus]